MCSNGIGFEISHFDQLKLAKALQGEVGIFQGKRPSKHTDSEMSDWRSLDCTQVDVASTDKDVTRVVKMDCNVCISCEYDTNTKDSDEVRQHTQRVLQAFCFLSHMNNIPSRDQSFTQNTQTDPRDFFNVNYNEYARTTKNTEKADKRNPSGANQNKNTDNPDQPEKGKRNRKSNNNTGGGGGGGGKRPRPSGDSTANTEVIIDTTDTETTTADQEVEKKKHRKKRKSRTKSQVNEGNVSEFALSVNTIDGDSSRPSHRKKSKHSHHKKPKLSEQDTNVVDMNTNPKLVTTEAARKTKIIPLSEIVQYNSRESVANYAKVLSNFSDYKRLNERDHEWLDWTGSDDSVSLKDSRKSLTPVDSPIDPNLLIFNRSTKLLDKVNSILGLNPYSRVVQKNGGIQVCWNPKSMEFLGVCINSLIFFWTTLSTLVALHTIFTTKEPLTISKRIIQTDFANHFTEALLVVCFTFFLSIWGVSCIMELGFHYAEFMSRFNQAICLTKYDVSEGIHAMIVMHLSCVFSFALAIILIFFGGRTTTATVREGCGFLGYTLIRSFNFKIRESIYYPLLEILGLLVFLHVFICFNVVILQFGVYAKAMENMAKQLNLRLVYALGMIVERRSDGSVKLVKKVIPYDKIYGEHLTVCSMFRHIGQVNDIVFGSLVLVMCFQIILSIWLFFEQLSQKQDVEREKYLSQVGGVQLAVSLRLRENDLESTVKALVVFQIVLLFCVSFVGHMHNAGENIQTCHHYIRRHGMIVCKSSKQRRFILSMTTNTFARLTPYWIGRALHLNRSFLLGILGFLFTASCVFNSYHPSRAGGIIMEHCDAYGQCIAYKVAKNNLGILYVAVPGVKPKEVTSNPLLTTTRRRIVTEKITKKPPLFNGSVPNGFVSPPCDANGGLPFNQKSYYVQCSTPWKGKSLPSVINIPYAFTRKKESHGTELYEYVTKPFLNSQLFPDCTNKGLYNFPKLEWSTMGPVHDCTGSPLDKTRADDCENLPFVTPNSTGETSQPVLRVVSTVGFPDDIDPNLGVLCCWQYTGFSNHDTQYKTCNLPSTKEINSRCNFHEDFKWKDGKRWNYHLGIIDRFGYETRRENMDNFLKQHENELRDCLCFADKHQPFPTPTSCTCQNKLLPPCTPGYFTHESIDFSLRCGQGFCTEPYFNDQFNHDDNLVSAASCPSSSETLTKLADCSGKVLLKVEKDDCNNWRLDTPDGDGNMLPPILTLQVLPLQVSTNELSSPAEGWAALCCFKYASSIFGNEDQIQYCNAPSLKAASSLQWCGANLKNVSRSLTGQRAIHRFRFQQKLAVITNRAYYSGNKFNARQGNVVKETWEKCICNGDSLPATHIVHKDCESAYMPPCIGAKGVPVEMGFLPEDKMRINCPLVDWKAQDKRFPNGMVYLPIVQRFDPVTKTFSTVKRFINNITGIRDEECPTGVSQDEFKGSPGEIFTDCYGETWNTSMVDDCGNPYVRGPVKGNPKMTKKPKLEMVALNQLDPSTGIAATDLRVVCCYQYPFAPPEQVSLCNMPSWDAFRTRCFTKRPPEMEEYVKILEATRATSKDPLKLPIGNTGREIWNVCICYHNISRCKQLSGVHG